ncbi:translocation/assembly module TamB domain-containing protein [Arachidicoccus sp.]|uniref:translocation/assembly module TamB domain-containing protein n=1 Tax=Arachidicoccus sp. TaxID=1872624 RepID=UPI003D21A5D9
MKKTLRIIFKLILWIIASIILLVALLTVLIQIPAVQNFAKNKVVIYIERKIHTRVSIGHISLDLPKSLEIDQVFFADQSKDTLLYGEKLKIGFSFFKLFKKQLNINAINLQGITAHISRGSDSVFNFDYIIDAFANNDEPQQSKHSSPSFKISLDKINLDTISVRFNDSISGTDAKLFLGHFDTRVKEFDLDAMRFSVPKINLSDVNMQLLQFNTAANRSIKTDTVVSQPLNLHLSLDNIDLSKIYVLYASPEIKANVRFTQLRLAFDKLDFINQKIAINNFSLDSTDAKIVLAKPEKTKEIIIKDAKKIDTLVSVSQSKPWTIKVKKVAISHNRLQFDNKAAIAIEKAVDYNHININDFNLAMDNLVYETDSTSGNIDQLSFAEKSGLTLKELKTSFFYGPNGAFLKNLRLKTPNSTIQQSLEITYPSLDAVSKNIGLLGLHVNLKDCQLSVKDILLFAPFLSKYPAINYYANSIVKINSKINGQVNDLHIQPTEISGIGNTNFSGDAYLKGLPNTSKAYLNINLKDFNTTRQDLLVLAPRGSVPSNISIPKSIHANGNFKGTIAQFVTALSLKTTEGNLTVNATIDRKQKDKERYTGHIVAHNVNVGNLLQQPKSFGKVSFHMNVKGNSFNPKKASLKLEGKVAQANIYGYNYHDLNIAAAAANGAYTLNANMEDSNLHFQINGDADLSKQYPSVKTTIVIDSINFQALHLSKAPRYFHGKIEANFPVAAVDSLNGALLASHLLFVDKSKRFVIDSIQLKSDYVKDTGLIQLNSPIANATFSGRYKLSKIPELLSTRLKKYFNTDLVDSSKRPVADDSLKAIKDSATDLVDAHFYAVVTKTPLLSALLPELKRLDTLELKGNLTNKNISLDASLPHAIYGTDTIRHLLLNIYTSDALYYQLNADAIKIGSSLRLLYPAIAGSALNNNLRTSLILRDADKKKYYHIGLLTKIDSGKYQFSLIPDSLMLDYARWEVAKDNRIQYGKNGILIHNFNISNGNQSLAINSEPQQINAPITVNLSNFRIETLTKMLKQDSLLVGGTINGNIVADSLAGNYKFNTDLKITNFNFRTDTIGNIAIKVNNDAKDALNTNVNISGNGNQINLKGLYYLAPESKFDLDLNVAKLNVKSIEGFTFGNIRRSSGDINGDLKISGTTAQPSIVGNLHFNKVGFNVAMLNSYYSMPDETIGFTNRGVIFNKVKLLDSTGNKATINGIIKTTDYATYGFDLGLRARDFRVINSTAADNPLYYGKLFVDANLTINGDLNQPKINGTLGVNDKTDLTVVLPSNDPSIEDRKGVVEFVDKNSKPPLDSIFLQHQLDSLKNSEVKGLDINATININKNAAFTIVVDPRNGDIVHLKGEGHLNGGIDASGKTNLTGTYEVNEGSYDLSYATVKRKFNFEKGSTIVWTGDPTTANLNFTAVYIAKVPPIDLVENQLGPNENATQYKEKLPFHVELKLKNELLKPDISFDIILPDSTYTLASSAIGVINNRLVQVRRDPNEMNKQVLGLLVLGHFIGDNPLQSSGGNGGLEGAIRNSVSSLLSDQLNRLADNLVTGVDLDFGLTSGEDYTSGTATNRTDLNVGVSKKFLNDRLTVSIGNNFNLEGAQAGEKATNIAGNVSVNYKLSRDGRYMLRAYRRDRFIVIQGQIIETGLGFTLTVDYNKFKEILQKERKHIKGKQKIKKNSIIK